MLQDVDPEQLTLQPPPAQLTLHELFPPQFTFVPEPTSTLQVLVP